MVEPADVRSVVCLDVTHPRAAGSDLVRHICQILSPSPAAPFQSTKSLHPTHFWVDRRRTPCLSLACCAASDTAPSCTPLPRPQNTLCVDTHAHLLAFGVCPKPLQGHAVTHNSQEATQPLPCAAPPTTDTPSQPSAHTDTPLILHLLALHVCAHEAQHAEARPLPRP